MGSFLHISIRTFLKRYIGRTRPIPGSPMHVCTTIIHRVWNGTFYQTGIGHFDYFWVRDFGITTKALIALGHTDRVHKTLTWALKHYIRAGKVTLCLDREGSSFDAPEASIDALPWLIYAVSVSNFHLNRAQQAFLTSEICRYNEIFIDKDTGLIKEKARFSELRDAVQYRQSAYTLCMLITLAEHSAALKLPLQYLHPKTYHELLEHEYWNGEYFNADIQNSAFSAESNLLPLWLNIVTDTQKRDSILNIIAQKKLTDPYPMRYTDQPEAFTYRWWERSIMNNYAGTTIWTWMGIMYIELLYRANHPLFEKELRSFESLIERHNTFPELLQPDGSLYQTPFYRAEQGMIWAALYAALMSELPFHRSRTTSHKTSRPAQL